MPDETPTPEVVHPTEPSPGEKADVEIKIDAHPDTTVNVELVGDIPVDPDAVAPEADPVIPPIFDSTIPPVEEPAPEPEPEDPEFPEPSESGPGE